MPYIVLVVAFSYLAVLSSKTYTWLFASEDAADWLTASHVWITPQPLGSPVYILLGHIADLLPGSDVLAMTIFLSVLPSAITVAMVYSIVYRLSQREAIGIVSAIVLLGSMIFLSQSTVLEEYALTTMFLTGAYLFHLRGQRKWTWVFLGLACGVHSLVFPIVLVWLVVDHHQWRKNLKAMPLFLLCGVLPYGMVLALMAMDTPRYMAGGLNWNSVSDYFFGPSSHVSGTLSIFDFPRRALQFGAITLASLGLAVVPIIKGARSKFDSKWLVMSGLLVALWFYLTCFFQTAWVFLILGMPAVAVLAGVGLSKMRRVHLRYIAGSAVALLILNAVFLNADTLSTAKPTAQALYEEIEGLPDGSVVVGTPRYTMTAVYCLSRGKDIVPLTACYIDDDEKFTDYLDYLHSKFGLEGEDSFEIIQSAWEQGRSDYYIGYNRGIVNKEACQCYWFSGDGLLLREIRGFTGVSSPFVEQATGTSGMLW